MNDLFINASVNPGDCLVKLNPDTNIYSFCQTAHQTPPAGATIIMLALLVFLLIVIFVLLRDVLNDY